MRCFLDNSFFTDPTKKNYFINFISLIINNTQGSVFQIFFFKKESVLLADFKLFVLLVI